MPLRYMSGFGNDFETEGLPGALPQGQNSPQRCPYGFMPSNLSGTSFTAPSGANERSWLYRMRPSVKHASRFTSVDVPIGKPRRISSRTACRLANCAGPFAHSQ